MKSIKKARGTLAGVLLLMLLLTMNSCGLKNVIPQEENTTAASGTTGLRITQTEDEPEPLTSDREAFYLELVTELQEELLAMKTELFSVKSAYEERLTELENAAKESREQAGAFSYSIEGGKATITAYIGNEIKVNIPDKVDGHTVVAIGDKAFLNNTFIQSVTLPEGIESVGWFAFSGCTSLGSVSLPQSVSSVSYGAFENCNASLTLFCKSGSYAEKYAQSYGIRLLSDNQ